MLHRAPAATGVQVPGNREMTPRIYDVSSGPEWTPVVTRTYRDDSFGG